MAKPRVSRTNLGYPVWTCVQVGDTVYVQIDHNCPEDEASIVACVEALTASGVDFTTYFDGLPPVDPDSGDRPAG